MRNFISAGLIGIALLWSIPAQAGEKPEATLFKTPDCGCCEGYASYLRQHGYKVTVEPSHNMPLIKRLAGVPERFEGCHTTKIGGYVVEGHVPIGSLEKLLRERPQIKGISLPGMPQGSPGMSGRKDAPFTIYEIAPGGQPKTFNVE